MSDHEIDRTILDLIAARGPSKTACPSEVARELAPQDWRPLMEAVRQRARKLASEGQLEITQGGTVVDATAAFHGPVRLRLPAVGED